MSITVQDAWDDWHNGDRDDTYPDTPTPVFAYGFRAGSKDPGVSIQAVWGRYNSGGRGAVPSALVEGVNRGATSR